MALNLVPHFVSRHYFPGEADWITKGGSAAFNSTNETLDTSLLDSLTPPQVTAMVCLGALIGIIFFSCTWLPVNHIVLRWRAQRETAAREARRQMV